MPRNTQTEQPTHVAKRPVASSSQLESDQDAVELLTEEHHEVKAMFEKFKKLKEQGNASNVEKKQLVDKCCQALTIHAEIEEEIFYPAVRKATGDDDMMDEAIVEHASAKQFIAQIGRMQPDDDLYDAMVTVLGEYIDHHVEEEENEMFKKARKTDVDLHALADQMDKRRTQLQAEMGAQQQAGAQKRSAKSKNLH